MVVGRPYPERVSVVDVVLVLLMAIELMLLSVNMNFVAFSRFLGDASGQVFVFFILTVAAADRVGSRVDYRKRAHQCLRRTIQSDSSTSLRPAIP